MEAVLVFPLYITLMGALFLIGEVTMGNIQLTIAERLAAIWGDRRVGFSSSDSATIDKYINGSFTTDGISVGGNHAKSMFTKGAGNYFAVLTGAVIDAHHKPTNISILFNAGNVFYNDAQKASELRLNTADEDHYHFFVLQRWDTSDKKHKRTVEAQKLWSDAVWPEITADDYPLSKTYPSGSSHSCSHYSRTFALTQYAQ